MNIAELAKVVEQCELDVQQRRDRAKTAWKSLKSGAKDAATPWRIVTVGAIAGFFVGRKQPGAASSAGGQLFSSLAQTVITALGASVTAGAAASSAADAAVSATVDATGPAPVAAAAHAATHAAPGQAYVPVAPGSSGGMHVPYVAEMADVEDRG